MRCNGRIDLLLTDRIAHSIIREKNIVYRENHVVGLEETICEREFIIVYRVHCQRVDYMNGMRHDKINLQSL